MRNYLVELRRPLEDGLLDGVRLAVTAKDSEDALRAAFEAAGIRLSRWDEVAVRQDDLAADHTLTVQTLRTQKPLLEDLLRDL